MDGVNVVYVALDIEGTDRVRKSEAAAGWAKRAGQVRIVAFGVTCPGSLMWPESNSGMIGTSFAG
jgi:hypothetical protein